MIKWGFFTIAPIIYRKQICLTYFSRRNISVKEIVESLNKKYYFYNDEIKLDQNRIVEIYDHKGNFTSRLPFSEAKERAKQSNMDILLKNEKGEYPKLQIKKYEEELFNLIKDKLSGISHDKIMRGSEEEIYKLIIINSKISMHDLQDKINLIKKTTSSSNNTRIKILLSSQDQDEIDKANLIFSKIKSSVNPNEFKFEEDGIIRYDFLDLSLKKNKIYKGKKSERQTENINPHMILMIKSKEKDQTKQESDLKNIKSLKELLTRINKALGDDTSNSKSQQEEDEERKFKEYINNMNEIKEMALKKMKKSKYLGQKLQPEDFELLNQVRGDSNDQELKIKREYIQSIYDSEILKIKMKFQLKVII